ncbi:MAG: PmoA family protein [Bacteroidales bacterium]|nr:PmoA family protein [Bacteroidales bacterium]
MINVILIIFYSTILAAGTMPNASDTVYGLNNTSAEFRQDTVLKKIDILFNSRLFTTFRYADTLEKPVFFPVYAPSGVAVTRGYPIDPKQGERTDHPHHTGLWFNYGDVNGIDFWNNSRAIPAERRCSYGKIICSQNSIFVNREDGSLQMVSLWIDCNGGVLLEEKTIYRFAPESPQVYSMKRYTRLTALTDSVVFGDSKEGMLGIRVARSFEMPIAKPAVLYDTILGIKGEPRIDSTGVNGRYTGSNGLSGKAVWGTRNSWITLSAEKEGDFISIAMADHPENHGFPSYWHARDYGLFSVNNFGVRTYDPQQAEARLVLKKDESITFRHLLLVKSGGFLSDEEMEEHARKFWNDGQK